ncbi:MAG TPA: hypothetical protein VLS93_04650 [Anaeromyxobacteraceae bacterium]|nr:hypothetical protein [Anaeromyxobacteraceae bacterium]
MRAAAAVLAVGLSLLAWSALAAARREGPAGAWLDGAAREGAVEAARRFAALSAHLHGSGGDPRFAERLDADEAVVAELLAEVAFARHAGRVEEPRLVRLEALEVRAAGAEVAEVRAREFWVTRTVAAGREEIRSDVVATRTAMRRGGAGWRVAGWTVEIPGDGEGGAR